MRRLLAFPLLLAALAGCKGDDGDGIDQKAVDADRAPLAAAVKRSGGNWDSLTPDEKKLFLDRGHGSEPAAKAVFGMMSGGPSVGPKKR